MKRLLLCVLLAGIFHMPSAAAGPLTWEECVQEAGQRNPDLLASLAAVRKARAAYHGSFSDFLPQISADLSLDQGSTKTRGVSSSLDDNTATLSAKEALFSGFGTTAKVRQRHAELKAAEAQLAQTKAQISFELKNGFAQLLYAQEQMKLTEAIAGRRQDNLRLVELRYQAGREHAGSYLRSKATAQQAGFDVDQARRALQVAQQQLPRLLGIRPMNRSWRAASCAPRRFLNSRRISRI